MKNKRYGSLKKIRSIAILKKIVSHLWLYKSLSIFSYSKAMQKKLNYDINSYKNASQKIKIDGINGIGKEYMKVSNALIFEGEYLKGEKNGKGVEYYDISGKIKFEGTYLNGKKIGGKEYDIDGNKILVLENGKGKKFFNNGNLQFKGEYYNGRRWKGKGYNYAGKEEYEIKYGKGKVKEYNFSGSLLFEGEYFNGKRNGLGKNYHLNGKIEFEGEYINGFRIGKGK